MACVPPTPPAPAHACREACDARLDDLRAALTAPDEERDELESELAPLEIAVRYEVEVLLSWGGPSDGFRLRCDRDGTVLDGTYFRADWGAHAEVELGRPDVELVAEWYLGGDPAAFLPEAAR